MKKLLKVMTVLVCMSVVAGGCRMAAPKFMGSASYGVSPKGKETAALIPVDRMLIWKAQLSLDVWNVSNSVSQAVEIIRKNGGYVEQKSDRGEESSYLVVRVPVKTFNSAIGSLESLGRVSSRSVEAEDVTEQYVDIQARLKNRIALRDRLKQLLEKAKDVKDILSIETELNRVQSDIDSMEGRIKILKDQVDFATISLHLSRREILGPVGYALKGLWWGIEKLFVIR